MDEHGMAGMAQRLPLQHIFDAHVRPAIQVPSGIRRTGSRRPLTGLMGVLGVVRFDDVVGCLIRADLGRLRRSRQHLQGNMPGIAVIVMRHTASTAQAHNSSLSCYPASTAIVSGPRLRMVPGHQDQGYTERREKPTAIINGYRWPVNWSRPNLIVYSHNPTAQPPWDCPEGGIRARFVPRPGERRRETGDSPESLVGG